jgi:UDP:flavonoid glycosyltransferase YjiC (YdhE family)
MAKIIFASYPETGHLNASFKIAKGLKSSGHQVSYLSLPDFEEHIRQQGFEFIALFEKLCPKGFLFESAVMNNIENIEAVLLQVSKAGQPLDRYLSQELRQILQRVEPDLLIIDLFLPDFALIAAQFGLPLLLLNTQFFNPWAERQAVYQPLIKWPELILSPREFDFPGAARKKNSRYVESSIDLKRKDVPFPWHRLDPHKSLLYCSFGSQSHIFNGSQKFFQVVIDAVVGKDDWQLVLTVGTHLRAEDFHSVPANAILVNTAPQLDILKRASIMLTHGGFNSVKEAIFFGVPMILFPMIRDHPAIAARVVYHGLGVRGELQKISVEQMRALINRVDKDSSCRARVESMARKFREAESSAPSLRSIEAVLAALRNKGRNRDAASALADVFS